VELGRAVSSEPEAWLITEGDWRNVGDERRYLRAVRRSPHAAVFVAENEDGIVGRLSLARDSHPASHHVADLGLMVAAGHLCRRAALLAPRLRPQSRTYLLVRALPASLPGNDHRTPATSGIPRSPPRLGRCSRSSAITGCSSSSSWSRWSPRASRCRARRRSWPRACSLPRAT